MQNKMKIRKGINLGGWMSQCDYTKEHLDTFITETDFAEIASLGFDHVRIPVDYNLFQNEDGSLIAEGFARLDNALALAEKYHLKVEKIFTLSQNFLPFFLHSRKKSLSLQRVFHGI